MIKTERLHEILTDCLFRDDELVNGKPEGEPGKDWIHVHGIVSQFGFHPKRVEGHREEIRSMLSEMPDAFFKGKGGGWSFLNLCIDREGNQWTGFHRTMVQLVVLGMAIGEVQYLLPRDMWDAFPGGMPYIQINMQGKSD